MTKHSHSISSDLKISIVSKSENPSLSIANTKLSLDAEGIKSKEDIDLLAKVFDAVNAFNPN